MSILVLKSVVVLAYLGMLTMNVLANALPLFGRSTGQISAQYPVLFTPAGFTFSIWGLIYLLLGGLVIAVLRLPPDRFSEPLFRVYLMAFALSCVFNALWLVFWHMDRLWASTCIIFALLVTLAVAHQTAPSAGWLRLPIQVTFGWVSVATIANLTIALYASNFGFGLPDIVYFVIVLFVGVCLVAAMLYFEHDIAFALVFVWAYFGIFMRHFYAGSLPLYLITALFGLVLIGLTVITAMQNYLSGYGH